MARNWPSSRSTRLAASMATCSNWLSMTIRPSPKEAVPIAQKLIEKDGVIAAVSGSYSGSTRAAAGIFQESDVPYISAYAIHPDITRAGDYVFRTSFVGEVQGRAGAKLVGEMLGLKRAVIVTIQNDFGQSLSAGFKGKAADFGVEIVAEYEYSIKDRQFGPIVSKIRSDNPDVIYATGYFFTAGPLVSQLRAAGITVPVIGQEGYDSQSYIEIAGQASEGTIITTSLDRDSDVPATKDFIAAFEAKSGHKVDMVAASAHTAVMVLADAMKKAGTTDRAAIRDAIAATDLDASTGHISFNALWRGSKVGSGAGRERRQLASLCGDRRCRPAGASVRVNALCRSGFRGGTIS